MKSLSVMIMLSEWWFGRSQYDSKIRPKVGFLAFSPSVFSSLVSLADVNFLITNFLVWVSANLTPRTKISIDVPVDFPGSSRSRLDSGIRKGPSGTTQLDSVLLFLIYFCQSGRHLESSRLSSLDLQVDHGAIRVLTSSSTLVRAFVPSHVRTPPPIQSDRRSSLVPCH